MRTNVIDLIIQMARHIRAGESLDQLNPRELNKATKAETAAAYSWIMQKAETGRLQKIQERAWQNSTPDMELLQALEQPVGGAQSAADMRRPARLRVLNAAERSVISTEAYGYLLELYNIGVLDGNNLESLIESAMMSSSEKLSMKTVKEMVVSIIFGRAPGGPNRMYLHGSETVN
ncbi:MAG: DUF494 family protein [Cyclonatronaceae bacterium]